MQIICKPVVILARTLGAPDIFEMLPFVGVALCRMESRCLALAAGQQPIFGQGRGDVRGYCLWCENYIRWSFVQQVQRGRVRQMQREKQAAIRKAIKVGDT